MILFIFWVNDWCCESIRVNRRLSDYTVWHLSLYSQGAFERQTIRIRRRTECEKKIAEKSRWLYFVFHVPLLLLCEIGDFDSLSESQDISISPQSYSNCVYISKLWNETKIDSVALTDYNLICIFGILCFIVGRK